MKKILIITSHYPPSNLTGVHRARLFAKYLPQFGWEPIVLTVSERHYEEKLDFDLNLLIPEGQRVSRVSAFPLTKPRLIGDLGLRAFFHLKKRAEEIIGHYQIDFVYILVPSFYISLLGPILFYKHRIKYGIDYIDPWVHFFPGSERIFSRHWFSTKISKLLEPFAVFKASLLTSVSFSYIKPIFLRNLRLNNSIQTLAIPYGWDAEERLLVDKIGKENILFQKSNKLQLVYAGAFLPSSDAVMFKFFQLIKENICLFQEVEFHFIGTGIFNSSTKRESITDIARRLDLYGTIIFEYPERISYFDVLSNINNSDGVLIIGGTESHYTPSKLFNAFVMDKPIFALLHADSNAIEIIKNTERGEVCSYIDLDSTIYFKAFLDKFTIWMHKTLSASWDFNYSKSDAYTAKNITAKLSSCLNQIS